MYKILLLFLFMTVESVSAEVLDYNQINNNAIVQTQNLANNQQQSIQQTTQQLTKLQHFNTSINETVNTITNIMNGVRTIKSYIEFN